MTRASRVALGALLVLAGAVCGFVAAAFLGAHCCVSPDSGLAGPAIVLGYGLLGAAGAGMAALLLSLALPPRGLIGLALPLAGIAAVLAGLGAKLYLQARAQTRAELQQAYARMPAFHATVTDTGNGSQRPFRRMALDWGERAYTVETVATGERRCRLALSGPQAVRMLGALRKVELVLAETPHPCAGTVGPARQELAFVIPERQPPDTRVRLALTAACLVRFPTLGAPLTTARAIHAENGLPSVCD